MLEKMGAFFDARLQEYDTHQLTCIEGAQAFYRFTAACLPHAPGARVLDLGCGTGLELEAYFQFNPTARVTGIDLAPGMLSALKRKLSGYSVQCVCGSYFDVPFGQQVYDAAVSVESLHHFTQEEKEPLYKKLFQALKPQGYLILTDYFAQSDQEEAQCRKALYALKRAEHIADDDFYHYDTPLTVQHEMDALRGGGFSTVECLGQWGATCTLKAVKS